MVNDIIKKNIDSLRIFMNHPVQAFVDEKPSSEPIKALVEMTKKINTDIPKKEIARVVKSEPIRKSYKVVSNKKPDVKSLIPKVDVSNEQLLERLDALELLLGLKSKNIYDYGSILQILANGLYIGNALSLNFKTGLTVSVNNQGGIDVTASGGGSMTVESLIGTQDGTNTVFTVTKTPVFINNAGQIMTNGNGFTLSGLTVTFDNPPSASPSPLQSFHN